MVTWEGGREGGREREREGMVRFETADFAAIDTNDE